MKRFFLIPTMSLLVATASTAEANVISPDNFNASGGGTVSLESTVVRFDGNVGIRLDHDFSQGGAARIMPYRVTDTNDAAWIGPDLASWSFWASVGNDYKAYIPNLTFYFDDGVSAYYSGTNVTHIVNVWPTSIGDADGIYNDADWWEFTSEQEWTYYFNSPGLGFPHPASGMTWADIVGENGVRPGYGPTNSRPLVNLNDAAIVGILLGYPGNIGSNVALTAYIDGFTIDGQTYSVIPEPTSIALIGLGGLALLARRGRKA